MYKLRLYHAHKSKFEDMRTLGDVSCVDFGSIMHI